MRCVRHKAAHFAYQLQKTMKGMGTDDDTLVRVVVSRCEIDMVQIKEEFQKMTGQTLEQYIAVSLPIILVWYMYDTNSERIIHVCRVLLSRSFFIGKF